MIPTVLRHASSCSLRGGGVRREPPKGVGIILFECTECGAVASSPRVSP